MYSSFRDEQTVPVRTTHTALNELGVDTQLPLCSQGASKPSADSLLSSLPALSSDARREREWRTLAPSPLNYATPSFTGAAQRKMAAALRCATSSHPPHPSCFPSLHRLQNVRSIRRPTLRRCRPHHPTEARLTRNRCQCRSDLPARCRGVPALWDAAGRASRHFQLECSI